MQEEELTEAGRDRSASLQRTGNNNQNKHTLRFTHMLTDDRLVSNMLTCAPALGLLGVAVSVVVCVGGFGRRYPLRGGLSLQALTSPVSWFGRVVRRLG